VVGKLPSALPDPSIPDVKAHDLVDLLPVAFGIMLLSTEGLGVARALASRQRYTLDANREFAAAWRSVLPQGFAIGSSRRSTPR
jgi:MFS superfamily sulfate permease-like transporter